MSADNGSLRTVGQREVRTQRRVVAFFEDVLGCAGLGDRRDGAGNANVGETGDGFAGGRPSSRARTASRAGRAGEREATEGQMTQLEQKESVGRFRPWSAGP